MSKKKTEMLVITPEAEQPELILLPSRGVLLNRFASLQGKLTKLTLDVEDTKSAMLHAAALLREHYDIIVSDARFTTPAPRDVGRELHATTPVPAQPAPAPIEEDEPRKLADEDNPMLAAARNQHVIIESPRTTPASEKDVAAIRKGALLDKDTADSPEAFKANILNTMGNLASAVKGGMGKPSTIPAQPERSKK